MKYLLIRRGRAVVVAVVMSCAAGEQLVAMIVDRDVENIHIQPMSVIQEVSQRAPKQVLGKSASEIGLANWQAIPHLVLSATDNRCEADEKTTCKLHLEVHGANVAYIVSSGDHAVYIKQTLSGVTRRDVQGAEKALPPQAGASIPDFFPLPRLLKALEDPSLSLTVTATEGGIITVTSEPTNVRKLPNDPLASLNTRRFKIDAATGELRAIEFTIASIGNSRLNKPAKVSYFNYKKAPSGVMYPEEIKFEIDGHLVNDYHVTQVDTTSTTFTEQ